jgi:hypothetical protein
MINTTNAVLPEVLEGFPGITLDEALAMASGDKRVTVDHARQEISFEVPERLVLNVSKIIVKHSSAIGAVAKAIVSVAKAMRSLVGGLKDDVEELVNEEIAEIEKDQRKAA